MRTDLATVALHGIGNTEGRCRRDRARDDQRPGGAIQVTYKGKPLYTFASDSPGQTTGQGVAGFQVVKAGGSTSSGSSTTTTAGGGGYGY